MNLEATPPQARVTFTHADTDGNKKVIFESYAFDGRWLFVFNKEDKTLNRREIRHDGDTINPFAIGTGIFLIPFNNPLGDIVTAFVAFTVQDETQHPDSVMIRLLPIADTDLASRYSYIEIGVSKLTSLPWCIRYRTPVFNERVELLFDHIKFNNDVIKEDFTIKAGRGIGVSEEPLGFKSSHPLPKK
jgi:hypothetical protein